MKQNNIRLKKIYSKIAFLLIIVLLCILIFKVVSDGIKINSISIANIKIDGLYLKLDKKLILEINNIDLRGFKSDEESSTPNIENISNIIKRAIDVASFFELLNIPSIQYANQTSSIYYDGSQYKIDVPYVLASFKLTNDGDDLLLDIEALKIKQEDLVISGRILYLEDGNIFAFDLESYINNRKDNIISYQGESNFKYLNIVLDSTSLNSIDILAPYIKMFDKDVYEWIFEKSNFSNITINRAYLYTKDLDSKNIDKVIVDNLYVSGILQNASVRLEDNLYPISTDEVIVLFDKGKLSFWTQNASYNGTMIDKGRVEISDFLAPQTLLNININSQKTLLDDNILGILNYYDISLPIKQIDGKTKSSLNLNILLPTQKYEIKVSPSGEFDIKDSNIDINGVNLFVKEANIKINESNVNILDSKVSLKDILDSKLNLNVNLDNKTMDLELKPSKLELKSGELEIINFNNKDLRANIDFSGDDFLIDILEFDVNVLIGQNIDVNINSFNKLLPYMPILTMLDIKNGFATLHIDENKNISLDSTIRNLKYPIYRLNKERIETLHISGEIAKNRIHLYDKLNEFDLEIMLESNDIDLNFGDMYVNIDEILDSKIPLFADLKNDTKGDSANSLNILIEGKNSTLGLFGYDVEFEESMLKTTANGFIGNGKNKNGIANIILDNGTISIEANNFNADFINKIFNKQIVYGGTFGIFGIYRDNKFVGDISMFDTSIQNMASLQNILALIDAIPSLVMFKLPGFSASGYEIDEANIRIGIDSNYLVLENININGSSVDITGKGMVDLNSQDLNINLSLSTMKSLSSIINKIPIVGYILLGDDGKITTELTIKGTISDPQTELSLLEDTAKAPIDILRRVFSPFELLVEELKKENKRRGRR